MANTHSLDLESTSSQRAYVNNDLGITNGNITEECWINIESTPSSGSQYRIIGKGDAGTHVTYGILYHNNGGTPRLLFWRVREGTSIDEIAVNGTLPTGIWIHVALTYDGTNLKGYLNGVLLGTSAFSGNGSSGANDEMVLGGWGATEYFDGKIDDVRVWNTARTQSEIQDNMGKELVGNESGLVGYWKLNNNYNDSTSNGYNLTSSGSPVFSTTIPFINNVKIVYPSVDSYIEDTSATTNFGTSGSMYVGEYNAGAQVDRALTTFPLTGVTGSVTTPTIVFKDVGTDFTDNTRTMRVYRLLRDWTNGGVTWNKYDGTNDWGTAGAGNTTTDRESTDIGSVSMPNPPVAGGFYTISLTESAVQDWVNGSVTNNGLLWKMDTETNDMHRFYTVDTSTVADRPWLYVEFTGGSPSPSLSPSLSPSASQSPSSSVSPSSSESRSVSLSPSSSQSPSSSESRSPSLSPSASPSPSSSESRSPSRSISASPSPSSSESRSQSRSISLSSSLSPSLSGSPSPSLSPSATPSPSSSISPSSSESVSASASVSPSASPSVSESLSSSLSPSPSSSPSASESRSPSVSPSLSPSATPSPSASPSVSESRSASLSESASISLSPSVSPSATQSSSPSASVSPSSSESPSISLSTSLSVSLSPSASLSPSPSPAIYVDKYSDTENTYTDKYSDTGNTYIDKYRNWY